MLTLFPLLAPLSTAALPPAWPIANQRPTHSQAADLSLEDQLRLLRTVSGAEAEAQIRRVQSAGAGLAEVVAALDDIAANPRAGTDLEAGWSAWSATDEHGVARPYQVYVPEAVAEGALAKGLIVHLHGAVSRPSYGKGLGTPDATGYGGMLWPKVADDLGFLVACPQGRDDCVWWRDEGAAHARAVVRDVKRRVHVPPRAVVATGFSDGASGCYYLSMADPEPYAGFIAMNGHPAVAASASGKQLYLRNMSLSRMIAATTHDDSLYPTRTVLPHLSSAIHHGAPMHVVSYPDMNHQPSYFGQQRPLFDEFLRNANRGDAPSGVGWVCSAAPGTSVPRVRWVEVLKVGPSARDVQRFEPTQHMTTPGRVRLGAALSPAAMTVSSVVPGSTAESCGLLPGDTLLSVNGEDVTTSRELRSALRKLIYTGEVALAVSRGGEQRTLKGRVPDFVPEPIYLRTEPTAWIQADWVELEPGHQMLVVDTFGVRRARLWLPRSEHEPQNVSVWINGSEASGELQQIDVAGALRHVATHGDSASLRTHFVEIDL